MLLRPGLPAQAREQDWRGRHGILIGSREEIEGDYSQLLSSSLFCLVVPGVPPAPLTLWAKALTCMSHLSIAHLSGLPS